MIVYSNKLNRCCYFCYLGHRIHTDEMMKNQQSFYTTLDDAPPIFE